MLNNDYPVVSIFVLTISVNRFLQVVPIGFDQTAISALTGGQSRDIDLQRIRKMIRQKKLSNKEAQFYKKIDQKQIQPEENMR